jgi:hypothetical protein
LVVGLWLEIFQVRERASARVGDDQIQSRTASGDGVIHLVEVIETRDIATHCSDCVSEFVDQRVEFWFRRPVTKT